jgi:lysophospholipid acyltransferase (LPLAT)-like uncharacterized protein
MKTRELRAKMIAWAAAIAVFLLRLTCRIRLHGDPRPALRRDGTRYVYAVLHAHQVAAIIDGEPGTGAMVSQSLDGEIIVPALRIRGIVPIRGSGGRGGREGRGGLAALKALVQHVVAGNPAYLAVDGPRGPRGRVQRGIAALAQRSDAAIVCLVPVPSRRWILSKAWDRLQIPKPFSTIDAYFADPICLRPSESEDQLRDRVEKTLRGLERQFDCEESAYSRVDEEPARPISCGAA